MIACAAHRLPEFRRSFTWLLEEPKGVDYGLAVFERQ
jgi:hypothetical protein